MYYKTLVQAQASFRIRDKEYELLKNFAVFHTEAALPQQMPCLGYVANKDPGVESRLA